MKNIVIFPQNKVCFLYALLHITSMSIRFYIKKWKSTSKTELHAEITRKNQ